jgi:hypothetical protein
MLTPEYTSFVRTPMGIEARPGRSHEESDAVHLALRR